MRRPAGQREGGPCYYCAREGHFLRNCLRKAAGLPRSAPFIEDKGGRRDERRWRDPLPVRQEWGKGRYKEEWGPQPPRRGTGGSHGGMSQGERADPGWTSGEGLPKP